MKLEKSLSPDRMLTEERGKNTDVFDRLTSAVRSKSNAKKKRSGMSSPDLLNWDNKGKSQRSRQAFNEILSQFVTMDKRSGADINGE